MLYWLDLRACTTSHTVAAPGGCTTILMFVAGVALILGGLALAVSNTRPARGEA
ncbi:hypothetical protein ACIQUG_21560 [Ensifer sp. NPDC090286]|uniref:hypothetical protein n=1 Tax=Ensifer sp. NPDC090286 TaxID=3363991 RepID=UPI00383A019E